LRKPGVVARSGLLQGERELALLDGAPALS
jgi:hypothetical protein